MSSRMLLAPLLVVGVFLSLPTVGEPRPPHPEQRVVDQVVAPALTTTQIPPSPPLDLVDMPLAFEAIARWSVALFDEASLVLPPLRFVHHGGDTTPCRGRAGLHRVADGVSVVEICAVEPSWPNQVMILHETAHAWTASQLSEERKLAFQELRGWEHWRNYEAAAWHENGTEQAAEILVWGLVDQPIRMVRIEDRSCADLEAGYRTLTGASPLHGYRDYC